jgi:uncharacterized protein YegP (UPF0339 family)
VRKLMCSLALFAAVAALVAAAAPTAVVARQKEKDKKDTKKDTKAVEPGAIEVYQAKDGWRFRVVNEEGKSIAIGTQGFEKKEDCLAAIEFVKTTFAKSKVTEIKGEKKKDDKK